AYALHVNPGYSYSVLTTSSTAPFYAPGVQTSFTILDQGNNLVGVSSDLGAFSSFTFTATQSVYFIKTFSSSVGFYGLRVENNSVPEVNGIGETITAGVVYTSSLDYASDSDHFYFPALAGHTYAVAIASAVPDLFLKISDSLTNVAVAYTASGGGIYEFTP